MKPASRTGFSLAAVSALVASAVAQTYTSCNPLNVTCPPDVALGTSFNETYNSQSSLDSTYWNVTGSPAPSFTEEGMTFTISQQGEAPTMNTNFYVLGGHVEVIMRASPGQGIISSIVLISDDLDEIDWEIMGGNTTSVENNYFGKGNTSERNAQYYSCNAPQSNFQNYTVNWDQNQIQWILNGDVVQTTTRAQAVIPGSNGTTMFPQTPMMLRLGNWAGGDPRNGNGTIEWAGGVTDFTKGPYTMTVQSIKIVDGTTNATQYSYGDKSGSFESIKVTQGQSAPAAKINPPASLTMSQRWGSLSSTAQIAIIASAGAVGLILLGLLSWCCCCKRPKKVRDGTEVTWNKEQVELLEHNRMMGEGAYAGGWNGQYAGGNPDSFVNYEQPTGYGQNTGYSQNTSYAQHSYYDKEGPSSSTAVAR